MEKIKQMKLNLNPNKFGYYGISYFDENNKFIHFVVKNIEDAYEFIAKKTDYTAERTFKGSKFEIWSY